MKRTTAKILTAIILLLSSVSTLQASQQSLNEGWIFSLGDYPTATQDQFDDSLWREVTTPHDWAFEGGYSMHGAQKDKGGYASGGIGWYRKTIHLTKEQLKGQYTFIDFDGVYMNSEVWINGEYLGKRPYGYIHFSYEITDYLKEGDNLLAVRVDNSLEPSARWYHGCGIYGDVHLRSKAKSYFELDGLTITTPSIDQKRGVVAITSEVVSRETKAEQYTLSCTILREGKRLQSTRQEVSLEEGLNKLSLELSIPSPELWSPENPALYDIELSLMDSKRKLIDNQTTHFGFRTIEWHAESGFHLNGSQYKLRGVCEHFEGGATGAITSEQIMRWRLQRLKDMGCNAIRCAHNPFLPIFYDLCDEMGFLVMDEIFDGWNKKADYDYGMQAFDEWWERDLRAWIRRGKNHPSIFMYSVGNETHGDVAVDLVRVCHEEDSTRTVTSGDSNPDDMDILGVNGRSEKMSFLDNYIPADRAFIATENPHTWQVRGYYRTHTWYRNGYPSTKQEPQWIPNLTEKEIFGYDWISPDKRRNSKQIFNSSYDNATVRVTARHLIEKLRDADWFSGSFRWTGYDYLGEAGYVHGGFPFRAFQSGALDLAGFEKDLYYLYQSQWGGGDMVHILPHWTHPVMTKGELIPVWVYTSGDEAELIVNGESLGRKRRGAKWDEMQLEWLVPWCEGEVEAVAYRNGVEIARTQQRTSGAPSRVEAEIYNGGDELSVVTLKQVDEKGTLYPYGENRVYVELRGEGRILSFESGSPVDVECNFMARSKECFFGLNRLFIEKWGAQDEPISLLTAVISGDKKLMLSNVVSINMQEFAIRGGDLPKRKLTVRYTTNGEEPTIGSRLYTQPFEVELGTIVKATIFDGARAIIDMEEHFTVEDGLYWGEPGAEPYDYGGEQAEMAKLEGGAYFSKKDGDGFYATGFVSFRQKGASVTWYQENDGAPFDANISIRYSQLLDGAKISQMELWNNDTFIGVIDFKNTQSPSSHWNEYAVKIPIVSGGNNIKLVALGGVNASPNIDQLTLIQ